MIGAITAGLFGTGVAASTTSYESIATTTVGAGGSATITFSSIPSTYKHLQLRALIQGNTTSFWTIVQFNSDTSANYSRHELRGDSGGTVSATGGGGASNIRMALQEGSSSYWTPCITDILDYADTNKYKTIRSLSGNDKNGAAVSPLNYTSGNWRSTSAVSTITLTSEQGGVFNQYSSFALYGIKG